MCARRTADDEEHEALIGIAGEQAAIGITEWAAIGVAGQLLRCS